MTTFTSTKYASRAAIGMILFCANVSEASILTRGINWIRSSCSRAAPGAGATAPALRRPSNADPRGAQNQDERRNWAVADSSNEDEKHRHQRQASRATAFGSANPALDTKTPARKRAAVPANPAPDTKTAAPERVRMKHKSAALSRNADCRHAKAAVHLKLNHPALALVPQAESKEAALQSLGKGEHGQVFQLNEQSVVKQVRPIRAIAVTRTAKMQRLHSEWTKNGQQGGECAICLEKFNAQEAATLPCKHSFCAGCIKDLADSKLEHKCPLCRNAFDPEAVNVNEFFKRAIEKQVQDSSVGNGTIASVIIEGKSLPNQWPVSDTIDWTKVTGWQPPGGVVEGPDTEILKLLEKTQEIEILTLLKPGHVNVVQMLSHQVYDDTDDGEAGYDITMEYVDGYPLRDVFDGNAPDLDTSRLPAKLFPQLANAFQYIHDKGVVHWDIHDRNIMVDKHGQVKVIDFGEAKSGQMIVENTDDIKNGGAYEYYRAPEIFGSLYRGSAFPQHKKINLGKVDVFALGVLFCEIILFDNPFADSSILEKAQAAQSEFKQVFRSHRAILNYNLYLPGDVGSDWADKAKAFFEFFQRDDCKLSRNIKDLIRDMVQFDPVQRLSISDVVKRTHPEFVAQPSSKLGKISILRYDKFRRGKSMRHKTFVARMSKAEFEELVGDLLPKDSMWEIKKKRIYLSADEISRFLNANPSADEIGNHFKAKLVAAVKVVKDSRAAQLADANSGLPE